MLTIRLSRIGKKKQAIYRLIISEKARDPYGRALEILGSYNPFSKELKAKNDRIAYWIGKGAGMSPTVNNLLIDKGIIKGEKIRASKAGQPKKGQPDAQPAAAAGAPKKEAADTAPEAEQANA